MLGKVEPSELGFTQCHEHLLISKGKSFEINPALCIDEPDKSIQDLKAYGLAGGGAVVDAQPGGCNRDAAGLEEISRKTGIHIIASTGFHKLQFYPEKHWIHTMSRKNLEQFYISELTQGMSLDIDREWKPKRIKSKAGIIKTALDVCGLSGRYEELFEAAAGAQKATDAPMMVHIEKGSRPEALAEFLKERDVDRGRVYFCHMDRACEKEETFLEILKTGITLEFDTIGRFKYHSDREELELIKKILRWGYEGQLLFSLDTTRVRLKSYDPKAVGLDYILETFLPAMREYGITEEQIQKISAENPRRILSW